MKISSIITGKKAEYKGKGPRVGAVWGSFGHSSDGFYFLSEIGRTIIS